MKKVVYKTFFAWDYDKEEKWLNYMSAKGWQLCDVGFCRYSFNEGTPGEYIYRLELFDNLALKNDRIQYIQFVEDTGAEQVGSLFNWLYFRKKAGASGFDLFSDIDSRIRHLNRISFISAPFSILGILNGIHNISLWYRYQMDNLSLVAGIICLTAGILLGCGFVNLYSKKRKLKKEKLLHE